MFPAAPDQQRRTVAVLLLAFTTGCATRMQLPDTSFEPPISRPAFPEDGGPTILVDEGHRNFHTTEGRYLPFATLLRRDGYVVRGSASPVTAAVLAQADIYVIANALPPKRTGWKLPIDAAFTEEEVAALRDWVFEGGSLFLIADHMPFPGAVEAIGAAFGLYFSNGFAYDGEGESRLVFRRSDGSLAEHPIAEGRDAAERVDQVKTFTGQAFRFDPFRDDVEVGALLVMSGDTSVRLPAVAWKFTEATPEIPAAGMLQGAAVRFGKGRVAAFGEAGMFSAQVLVRGKETRTSGMTSPGAEQNAQFLLNVVHWLSGLLD